MGNRQSQLQLTIPEYGVMSGFCYAFSKRLLEKLKELADTSKIGEKESRPTDIARMVATSLAQQINYYRGIEGIQDILNVMNLAAEYLAIFEKKD